MTWASHGRHISRCCGSRRRGSARRMRRMRGPCQWRNCAFDLSFLNPAVRGSMRSMAELSDDLGQDALSDRRLAAVVFTDVVGYSAMMHADEVATIPRVRADRDRMRGAWTLRGGECLNSMGAGLTLAFG